MLFFYNEVIITHNLQRIKHYLEFLTLTDMFWGVFRLKMLKTLVKYYEWSG